MRDFLFGLLILGIVCYFALDFAGINMIGEIVNLIKIYTIF